MHARLLFAALAAAGLSLIDTQTLRADALKEAEEVVRSAGKLSGRLGKAVLLDLNVAADIGGTKLEGRKASGRLGVIDGGTKFFVEFKRGGTVVMGTEEEGTTFRGTWSQSGKTITMQAGASTFKGMLEGNRISGTRSRKNARTLVDTVDTWEVVLEK
jgi:hypothetical protein